MARRWIRDGGVVIATGSEQVGSRTTFEFVETVASGATLQVTFNLREVSKACRFLSDYAVYLWDCQREGEYLLCGLGEIDAYAFSPPGQSNPRPYRSVAAACYAGRFPRVRLDVYDARSSKPAAPRGESVTRMLLPRGLCAAIFQNPPSTLAQTHFADNNRRDFAASIPSSVRIRSALSRPKVGQAIDQCSES